MSLFVSKRLFLLFGVAILVVSPILLGGFWVWAAEESIDTLIENREDELDEIKAKIKAYKQIVDLKQRQGAALSDQLEGVEAQVKGLELQIQANAQELRILNEEIVSLGNRIDQKEVVIVSQKKILTEIMRGSYEEKTGFLSNSLPIPRVLPIRSKRKNGPIVRDRKCAKCWDR